METGSCPCLSWSTSTRSSVSAWRAWASNPCPSRTCSVRCSTWSSPRARVSLPLHPPQHLPSSLSYIRPAIPPSFPCSLPFFILSHLPFHHSIVFPFFNLSFCPSFPPSSLIPPLYSVPSFRPCILHCSLPSFLPLSIIHLSFRPCSLLCPPSSHPLFHLSLVSTFPPRLSIDRFFFFATFHPSVHPSVLPARSQRVCDP